MPRELYKPFSLQGRVVLITGASAGIGEAAAWRFAEAGCNLILIARRADRLEALKAELEQEYNIKVHLVVLDVRDTDAIAALPESLPSEFQNVYGLVNNAGLALGVDSVDTLSIDDARTMLECNVLGLVAFTRAFSPGMRSRNAGHIINMSSIAAHESYSGGSMYCATKHAVDAITVAARHEFVGTDVRVTAISPGAVKTEFSVVRFAGDEDKADKVYEGIHPLTAADVADNVLYAATRPAHVQISEIVMLATYQCSAKTLARVLLKE